MEPVDVSTVHFPSSDGVRLEGDLLEPPASRGSAVVCHPHPLYGGTRRDAVVATICRALVQAGRRVLRFDFRGVGGSSGIHSGGPAEKDDLRAAIEALAPTDGLVIAGYSFGADVALDVDEPTARGWLGVAPPLSVFSNYVAAEDPRPKELLVGSHDQFRSAEALHATTEAWAGTHITAVDSADHFFLGANSKVGELIVAASRRLG